MPWRRPTSVKSTWGKEATRIPNQMTRRVRRANRQSGRSPLNNDRPPFVGTFGRDTCGDSVTRLAIPTDTCWKAW